MSKKLIYFLLYLCFSGFYSFAQYEIPILEIRAKVVAENNSPITGATVYNTKKRNVTSADDVGYFFITISKFDVIRVSAIGYNERYISFKDSVNYPDKIFNIILEQKLYDIATVDIFDARWEDFLFDFQQIDLVDNSTKDKVADWMRLSIDPYELSARKTPMPEGVGLTIPLNFKSKQDKQNEIVEQLKRRDALQQIVEQKYNKNLVSNITGLQNEELCEFMAVCSINDKYILQSNDYDIIIRITKTFEQYQKNKSHNNSLEIRN